MNATKAKKTPLSVGVLDTLIGFHLAKARVTTQALFLRHVGQPLNLRPVEYSLLMLLHANTGLTPKQLCQMLALSGPALTMLLDRMQERGLIERVRSEVDRRSQQILLTTVGQDFVAELVRRTPLIEKEIDEGLTPAERAILIELLDKVANHQIQVQESESDGS
jgi:DNA-binding MarR family transcriptional regulator